MALFASHISMLSTKRGSTKEEKISIEVHVMLIFKENLTLFFLLSSNMEPSIVYASEQ